LARRQRLYACASVYTADRGHGPVHIWKGNSCIKGEEYAEGSRRVSGGKDFPIWWGPCTIVKDGAVDGVK